MTTATKTPTFETIIADHGETIANILNHDISIEPGTFARQVSDASALVEYLPYTDYSEYIRLACAATFLIDAVSLPDDYPPKAVLLSRADNYLKGMGLLDDFS